MSGWIQREDRLFDPASGALVGYIDLNGREQLLNAPAIQALVSAPWKNGLRADPTKRFRELLPTTDGTPWDDRAGSGMTVTVDSAVLFDRKPTLRLDIPAGSTGTYRIGTSAAVCPTPYNWTGTGLTVALMSSNMTAVSGCNVFLGDASLANFHNFGGQTLAANVPEAGWKAGEWILARGTVANIGAGAPTFPGIKRVRLNLAVTSVGTATSVWIGFLGIVAPKRTTLVVSVDDGYRSGYDFVAQLARYYRVPVSFGIDRAYVGTGGYFTEAMIRELHADPSDLFEFVTHGYANSNVGIGDTLYVQQQIDTRAYLRSLGITGDGPNHHPWVQSLQTDGAIAGLSAAGFLSARLGAATPKSVHDSHFATRQDKRVWQQLVAISPTTGVSLATAQAAITAAAAEGYGITHLNMHQAAAADAASPMTWSYDKWVDMFGWLDAQRDAGAFDIKCWGRAYADAVGVGYSK